MSRLPSFVGLLALAWAGLTAAQTTPAPSPPTVEAVEPKPAPEDRIVGDPADPAAVPLQRRETRVEQVREGNRVVEVIVTPALTNRSYFMFNREGQRPLSPGGERPNLSTPQFFKFEF